MSDVIYYWWCCHSYSQQPRARFPWRVLLCRRSVFVGRGRFGGFLYSLHFRRISYKYLEHRSAARIKQFLWKILELLLTPPWPYPKKQMGDCTVYLLSIHERITAPTLPGSSMALYMLNYSTAVTDLAKFIRKSTLNPWRTASQELISCSGITLSRPCRQSMILGTSIFIVMSGWHFDSSGLQMTIGLPLRARTCWQAFKDLIERSSQVIIMIYWESPLNENQVTVL